jgi:hypothetical protein
LIWPLSGRDPSGDPSRQNGRPNQQWRPECAEIPAKGSDESLISLIIHPDVSELGEGIRMLESQ